MSYRNYNVISFNGLKFLLKILNIMISLSIRCGNR